VDLRHQSTVAGRTGPRGGKSGGTKSEGPARGTSWPFGQ
jgi:hypothetical protein